MIRRVAKSFGDLLIARKDTKAIEKSNGWIPDRKQVPRGQDPTTGELIPFKMGDFRNHLTGDRCLGTYLLNTDNQVKFFALDIDLSSHDGSDPKHPAPHWYAIHDPEAFDDRSEPILDLETHEGPLEAALHDPSNPAYRWARSILWSTMLGISQEVTRQLELPVLPVISGGGGHIIVPLGQLTPAVEARDLARAIMERTSFVPDKGDIFWKSPNEHAGVTVEVFPKQDALPDKGGFGNLLRLPLGMHMQTKKRTYFLDTMPRISDPAWALPRANSITTLDQVMDFFGFGVDA